MPVIWQAFRGFLAALRATQLRGRSFRVLYGFAGGRDGDGPVASLIDVNGTLYGVTAAGGRPGARPVRRKCYTASLTTRTGGIPSHP